jgi:anaerobic magnesium-protoporphyrin IX monomethyl ester cyclase
MKVALIGAELEENLGLRYIASALERHEHEVKIIPFNSQYDISRAVRQITGFKPQITGLSMVFTGRAKEFCQLAQTLRDEGYSGHIIAGGHFASFNCIQLLKDFPSFDSVGLGEGEELVCALADNLDNICQIPGLCYRRADGTLATNPSAGNPDNLDALPFPKRTEFHEYFDKPIASILSSRGCWRNCAFCSINAWYKRGGGKKFRLRSVENIVAEMKELYFLHRVRIFNFQDDNFFLQNQTQALRRFEEIRAGLRREGIEGIAIAIKARPDSITFDSIKVLDDLGLFRVFLGVENASENGLSNLNRKCTLEMILNALRILNDFDIHVAYNILMFEPDTVMSDILTNLRFIERHIDNPFNFCRAEAYAGTGLEEKLLAEDRLLGDYFGFDYRLKDPKSEAFHQIANYAFFNRNFSDSGLHYFNMQVDFYFQLLRRFNPEVLKQTLCGTVRSFIKQTNLDTYMHLCQIYDFVTTVDPDNQVTIRSFARDMRQLVDERSRQLRAQGEDIQNQLGEAYKHPGRKIKALYTPTAGAGLQLLGGMARPYRSSDSPKELEFGVRAIKSQASPELLGIAPAPMPYRIFREQLAKQNQERR